MHSGRHVVNIDLQPLGLKSDRNEGGILGLKFKIQIFTFSQHKQFISTQTMLIHRKKSTHMCPFPIPPVLEKIKIEVNMNVTPGTDYVFNWHQIRAR